MSVRLVIVGGGGHGHVVADAIVAAGRAGQAVETVGFLDDRELRRSVAPGGLPILGPVAALDDVPHDAVVVAIGDNRARWRIHCSLREQGERFYTVRHPSATIAESTHVGAGTMIGAGVVIGPHARLGDATILNTGCTVDHHNAIGDAAHVAPGAHTGGHVSIGDGALVGLGASVGPGVRVGAWATVGLGAAVVNDVEPGTTVVGVPARCQSRRT